jgi:hypothetical protein
MVGLFKLSLSGKPGKERNANLVEAFNSWITAKGVF